MNLIDGLLFQFENKQKSARFRYFLIASFSLLISVKICLVYISETYQLSLLKTYDVSMYINCLAIYLAVLLVVSFFKQLKKILFFLMIVLIGLAVILDNFWGVDIYEYQYNSPSQTTTLVIEESAFLLGSTITAYEKKNGIFKKKIPEIVFNIDDGFTPFKHGMFRLNWISDKEVDITYYTNFGDRWKTEKAVFK